MKNLGNSEDSASGSERGEEMGSVKKKGKKDEKGDMTETE